MSSVSLLHDAIRANNLSQVQDLVQDQLATVGGPKRRRKRRRGVAALLDTDNAGHNALHIAAMNGHTAILEYLVEKSVAAAAAAAAGGGGGTANIVEVQTPSGETALHLACFEGHISTVRYLVGPDCQANQCGSRDDARGRNASAHGLCCGSFGHCPISG
jgi:Ankyrin repeats (3 copies)